MQFSIFKYDFPIFFLCQELGKKLFKRRRVLGKEKRKRRQIVGAVIDEGLTTIHHLKKRKSVSFSEIHLMYQWIPPPVILTDFFFFYFRSSPRANITLSGKKRRKLLKQLHHMQQEKSGMEGMKILHSHFRRFLNMQSESVKTLLRFINYSTERLFLDNTY